ncbi:MAG: acetoin utilization deacetylase AcuC-like enzyme [Nonlabens sp.]
MDVLESDKLGKLSMTLGGCKERDLFALSAFAKARSKNNSLIPIQCSMGGGYSPEIKTIIEAHANTFRMARSIFS